MNKRFYNWLLILMLISLSGTIAIQSFWYKNSLVINKELFGRMVNESLYKAVQQYEIIQDVKRIDEGINDDASKRNGKSYRQPESLKDEAPATGNNKSPLTPAPLDSNVNKKRIIPTPINPRVGFDIGFQDWNASRPIDVVRLKIIIEDALTQMGINNPFNYAIFSHDSILQSDITETAVQQWYKIKLFRDDIFSRDLFLGICFPGLHVYLKHNSLLKVLSIFFILLICLTYYLSIIFMIRQKKLSVLKTDFINNMSHEFKTPITTIGLAIDSILAEEVITNKERVNFYSQMIRKENQRMNEQVERILQVARLDRKELYFRLQEVNVHDLIRETIDGISIQIENRGGRIDTKFEAVNPIIATDPIHFTNLVNNLLDNANKYSPDAPQIKVSTSNDQKGVYLTVEDKGIGISKMVQAKIFDKYYRLTSVNLVSTKGFGIGLSYIKAILRLNKGNIKVYSEEGKGSRFVVFIPYSRKKRQKI